MSEFRDKMISDHYWRTKAMCDVMAKEMIFEHKHGISIKGWHALKDIYKPNGYSSVSGYTFK